MEREPRQGRFGHADIDIPELPLVRLDAADHFVQGPTSGVLTVALRPQARVQVCANDVAREDAGSTWVR